MIYTHCELRLTGDPAVLKKFNKDHWVPGIPWSFCPVAPVTAMDDEVLLAAWGCCSGPEPIGSCPFEVMYRGIRLRFRCAGGPPVTWLAKLAKKYPELNLYFTHATEATAVHGGISYVHGVIRTNEVEGDSQSTDDEVDNLLR